MGRAVIDLKLLRTSTLPSSSAAAGVAQGGTGLNVQPATASAAAPSAPSTPFARTSRPIVADFEAVRAGVRTVIETTVIDLSVARSIATGNALLLSIQGTAYYIDKGADVGQATIHIQDQTFTPANTINLFPGDANNNIPFTFWMIENTAQAGKVLRIHYGTDIIFQPGIGGNVVFTGGVTIARTLAGAPVGDDAATSADQAFYRSSGFLAGVAAQNPYAQLFNPGAKRLYLDNVWLSNSGLNDEIFGAHDTVALATLVGAGINKRTGAATSTANVNSASLAADPGTQGPLTEILQGPANGRVEKNFRGPIIIDPGKGYNVKGGTQNVGMQITFEYREY